MTANTTTTNNAAAEPTKEAVADNNTWSLRKKIVVGTAATIAIGCFGYCAYKFFSPEAVAEVVENTAEVLGEVAEASVEAIS